MDKASALISEWLYNTTTSACCSRCTVQVTKATPSGVAVSRCWVMTERVPDRRGEGCGSVLILL